MGFGATVQQKENGVRAHSGGFQQTPAHSTLQCGIIRPFCLKGPPPLKFPGFYQPISLLRKIWHLSFRPLASSCAYLLRQERYLQCFNFVLHNQNNAVNGSIKQASRYDLPFIKLRLNCYWNCLGILILLCKNKIH